MWLFFYIEKSKRKLLPFFCYHMTQLDKLHLEYPFLCLVKKARVPVVVALLAVIYCKVQNPRQIAQQFRSKSHSDSGVNRTPIPEQIAHF